jgi:hypothetical protein
LNWGNGKRSQIEQLINVRLNEVLLVAQAALPESQFTAFRKLTLNQFGKSGLGKELDRLFKSKDYKER